ncbi:MAG: carboxypeptidase regulatory-like domain-containing protein [Deltaproteobacteria bacterium]|nr:carboxypeptidase regulatory-like domain-containing protein [Deltaproteobacteria bacterium]
MSSARGRSSSAIALVLLGTIACAQRIAPPDGHRIAGRVHGVQGLASVRVFLDGETPVATDEFGTFVFDDVQNGKHVVSVQTEFSTLEGAVGSAVVLEGGNVDNVLLTVTPIGRITGKVVNALGDGVSQARVFAAGTAAVAFSQTDGTFALERVPLGVRTLVATREGAATRLEGVKVVPTGTNGIVLIFESDGGGDPTKPNEIPVIASLTFAPKDNQADNPRAIPAASKMKPALIHAQSTLSLEVVASDPEGGALSYLWSVDRGVLSGGDAPKVEWIAGNSNAEVLAAVFDPRGGSATARQRFTVPDRSIRGASLSGTKLYYSEERHNDTRDILSFDLASNEEQVVFEADEEQHAPRVVGNVLVFADQVFTFVQPIVFRMRVINLGTAAETTYGQTLSQDQGFGIDYRLYTPLSGTSVTYFSSSPSLAPVGLGLFDPQAGTYQAFSALPGIGTPPTYPCYVRSNGETYGVVNNELYRYTPGARTLVATLPQPGCSEMQVSGGFAVIRVSDVFDPLTVVRLSGGAGAVRQIGVESRSFAMNGTRVAYTDKRGGFTGVFVEDLSGVLPARAVPVRGFLDRRVLDFDGARVVYGEVETASGVTFFSSESLQVYTL